LPYNSKNFRRRYEFRDDLC